jgi:hypothetical protein
VDAHGVVSLRAVQVAVKEYLAQGKDGYNVLAVSPAA